MVAGVHENEIAQDNFNHPGIAGVDPTLDELVNVQVTSVGTTPTGKRYGTLTATISSATPDVSVQGVLSAAQPSPTTPVAGGTVTLQLGSGQATWEAQLAGTFSAGSDVTFEGSDDNFTTVFPLVGYNASLISPPAIESIGGPGPFIIWGPAGGYQQVRMRADALHAGDAIAVRLYGTTAPRGSSNGGAITSADGGLFTIGSTTDITATSDTGTWTLMALFKRIAQKLTSLVTNTSAFTDSQTSGTMVVDGDTVTIPLPGGQSTALVQILGTFSGTVLFEVSPDGGITWYSKVLNQEGAQNTNASSATAPGSWSGSIAGYTHLRTRLHPVSSGSVAILLRASAGARVVTVANAQALGTATKANSASITMATDDPLLLDVFNSTPTTISAATTFSGVPTVSQLTANSFALLSNPGRMATFLAELSTSAFVGTLTFYGLMADGTTLQAISGHQRGTANVGSSVAINAGVAINQAWAGNLAAFKSLYMVCTSFTSGAISVQAGLSMAPYAVTITSISDGADVSQGATTSAAYTDTSGVASGSIVSILKGLFARLASVFSDSAASGTINALNGVVSAACPSAQSTWGAQISNTFVGTLTFQASFDGGITYQTVKGRLVGTDTTSSTVVSNTSPTVLEYRGNLAGATNFQVLMSAYTSGTATIGIRFSAAIDAVSITNTVAQNLTQVNGAAHGVTNPVYANIVNQALGALLYNWNGGGPNSQFYDRMRSVVGLKPMTATISSGGGVGSVQIVTAANPTGLQCSQWVWLTGGTPEMVLTSPSGTYTPGSATIPITSAILNAGHTGIAYLAYDPQGAGPGTSAFNWDSILPFAMALNNGGKGLLAQGDANGNLQIVQMLSNATLSNTNPMPSQFVNQPNYIALSSPPAATNIGADTTFTFNQQVNSVFLQNNTGADLHYAFDTAASAGSKVLPTGQSIIYPKKVTAVHLYTAAAQNVNGTSSGNIVLEGEQ